MNNDRPLRAVLMKTLHCFGTTFNKGEIYDIAEFSTSDGRPVVYLKLGSGVLAVMPSAIQILAPEPKPRKPNKRKWQKKKKNVS